MSMYYCKKTSWNGLQPVFEQFSNMSKLRQLATELTPNLGNCNHKMDSTKCQFGSVLGLLLVPWTRPSNTTCVGQQLCVLLLAACRIVSVKCVGVLFGVGCMCGDSGNVGGVGCGVG